MSWVSDLFHGDKTVNNAASGLMATGSTATTQGLGDTTAASNFWQNILNGHASQSLAPQISDIQKQGSEKLNSMAQFGNRSGGNNSAASMVTDNTNASINDLIAKLTGSAATNIGSLGTNLLNTGTTATGTGAQLRLENKSMFSNLLNQFAKGAGQAAGTAALGG